MGSGSTVSLDLSSRVWDLSESDSEMFGATDVGVVVVIDGSDSELLTVDVETTVFNDDDDVEPVEGSENTRITIYLTSDILLVVEACL